MKLKLLISVGCLAILFSCKNQSDERKEYYDNGNIKKKTVFLSPDDKSTYREYAFFEDETLKDITEFEKGIRHGRNFSYYQNGNIKSVYYYDHGKLTSIGRFFDENGRITDKGLFINDSMVVKEEFYYHDDLMQTNVFSKIGGDFAEAGSLLYDKKGMFGLDNSFYFITSSLDSVPVQDSLQVNVTMIAHKYPGSKISLTLGNLDENLNFTGPKRELASDSLSLSFYVKPEIRGYNLVLGRLHYSNPDPKAKTRDKEYIFYHDFLAY